MMKKTHIKCNNVTKKFICFQLGDWEREKGREATEQQKKKS